MKCFTTSCWLAVTCFCEGISFVLASLWWYMWCVYWICTSNYMHVRPVLISTLYQSLWGASCLNTGISSPLFLAFLSSFILPFIFFHSASNPLQPWSLSLSYVWPSLILALCLYPRHPSLSQASFCFNETDVPSLIKTRSTTVMKEWTSVRKREGERKTSQS